MNTTKVSATLDINEKDLEKILHYIKAYWPKLIRDNPKDDGTLIGLPFPYVVPSASEFFQEMYYWDSYPVILALFTYKKYTKLAFGMVENLLYLIDRFGIIPNASRFYFLTRSQPPLLSHAVWHVYELNKDDKWLARAIKLVEKEYKNVWMNDQHPNRRKIYKGLSRYYDVNVLDDLAEAESGWDMTARYGGKSLNYLPIDLNCLLYVYERDIANVYKILGNSKREKMYRSLAIVRAKMINKLMWNEKKGFYYDYNFVKEMQSKALTVAGFYPMTVGIATKSQANKMVKVIRAKFLKKYGIVQGEKFADGKQWDYPNGWAFMQLRVIEGLMAYRYDKLAHRVIKSWIGINMKLFEESGKLWEKYDVVNGRVGLADRYPTQHGFAWTNACFLLLLNMVSQMGESSGENERDHVIPKRVF